MFTGTSVFGTLNHRRRREASWRSRRGAFAPREAECEEGGNEHDSWEWASGIGVFSTSYLAIACLDGGFTYIRVNPAYT